MVIVKDIFSGLLQNNKIEKKKRKKKEDISSGYLLVYVTVHFVGSLCNIIN